MQHQALTVFHDAAVSKGETQVDSRTRASDDLPGDLNRGEATILREGLPEPVKEARRLNLQTNQNPVRTNEASQRLSVSSRDLASAALQLKKAAPEARRHGHNLRMGVVKLLPKGRRDVGVCLCELTAAGRLIGE
jgi:hypothetical protein